MANGWLDVDVDVDVGGDNHLSAPLVLQQRRFLGALEKRIRALDARDNDGDAESSWRTDPALRFDVTSLITKLEGEHEGNAAEKTNLIKRARELLGELDAPTIPPFCKSAAAVAAVAATTQHLGERQAKKHVDRLLGLKINEPEDDHDEQEARSEAIARGISNIRQRRRAQQNNTSEELSGDGASPLKLDEATAARLEEQARAQDVLTDDLVSLVSEFKSGAKEVQRRLGDRAKLLDRTEEVVERSAAHAKQKAKEATRLLETNAGGLGTCTMLLAVFCALGVFTWMFVLIRFTRVK